MQYTIMKQLLGNKTIVELVVRLNFYRDNRSVHMQEQTHKKPNQHDKNQIILT